MSSSHARVIAIVGLVVAGAAAGCADLPPLGECGNGIVERTTGEDCDEADGERCFSCLLVCDQDLPAAGVCPDGMRCCPADERCGVDELCRRPSGLFAPKGRAPFPAIAHAVADVDGDGIGDAFGVTGERASFLFGSASGDLARTGSARIPPLSRPDSQVSFQTTRYFEELAAPGVVVPTRIGFSALVATEGLLVSPTLPELDIEPGDGAIPIRALAATPTTTGAYVTLIASRASDGTPPGPDRLELRVYVDRQIVVTDPTPCGRAFPLPAPLAGDPGTTVGDLRITPVGLIEHAVVAVGRIELGGPDAPFTIQERALCMYPADPIGVGIPLPIEPNVVVSRVRPDQLDNDSCPEVVYEVLAPDGQRRVYVVDTTGAATCTAGAHQLVAAGRLAGTGDINADGVSEAIVGTRVFANLLGTPLAIPGIVLPIGLADAVVADVNRDLRPDIVATSQPSPDLTVLISGPFGFAPHTVGSAGALGDLVTADFDADTYPDVAAIEELAQGTTRLVVGFGGPSGPTQLDSLGRIPAADSLVAFRDVEPPSAADPFADLILIHRTDEGNDELSQFSGAGNRALSSEIDLTAEFPLGDGGKAFGRTIASGSLIPPDDGLDFCMVSFIDPITATPETEDIAFAFCVGGQGEALAPGYLAHDDGFVFTETGAKDVIQASEALPLLVGARIGDRGALVAVRRDTEGDPAIIVMPPPAVLGSSGPPGFAPRTLRGIVPVPSPPAGRIMRELVTTLRAVELDGDPDSELLLSIVDLAVIPGDPQRDPLVAARVMRIDLSLSAGVASAVVTPLIDQTDRDCADAGLIELGEVSPTGVAAPGPELVILCFERRQIATRVLALYLADPDPVPIDVGSTAGAFGAIAVGDVTGDRLDDLVILDGVGNEATASVLAQCAASDTAACTTVTATGGP